MLFSVLNLSKQGNELYITFYLLDKRTLHCQISFPLEVLFLFIWEVLLMMSNKAPEFLDTM